jgi:hypothetical protein
MTDVFISYAHGDSAFADALSKRLKSTGLTVWLDSSVLIGGEEYRAQIQQQVTSAKVVLLLLSKHSQRSTSVHEELVRALETGEPQRVIPVLLDDEAESNVVWPLVADRQAVRGNSRDGLMDDVVSVVSKAIRGPSEIASRARKITLIATSVVALAGVLGSLFSAQFARNQEAQRIRYTVQVFDATTSSGIASASVSLSAASTAKVGETDGLGRVTFTLDQADAGNSANIVARKEGFRDSTFHGVVPADSGVVSLRLEPAEAPKPQPVQADPARVKETLVIRSGPRLSGARKAFSEWYELCSGELPRNSTIDTADFSLSGDRSCGAWADCREKTDKRTASQVCWEFRLQGHDEWPASGQAMSEGVLRIVILRPAK